MATSMPLLMAICSKCIWCRGLSRVFEAYGKQWLSIDRATVKRLADSTSLSPYLHFERAGGRVTRCALKKLPVGADAEALKKIVGSAFDVAWSLFGRFQTCPVCHGAATQFEARGTEIVTFIAKCGNDGPCGNLKWGLVDIGQGRQPIPHLWRDGWSEEARLLPEAHGGLASLWTGHLQIASLCSHENRTDLDCISPYTGECRREGVSRDGCARCDSLPQD